MVALHMPIRCIEATRYDYIYCYAEDDEDDGARLTGHKLVCPVSHPSRAHGADMVRGTGSAANKMVFNTGVQASQVEFIRNQLGSIVTLDETPPTFTALEIQDMTRWS